MRWSRGQTWGTSPVLGEVVVMKFGVCNLAAVVTSLQVGLLRRWMALVSWLSVMNIGACGSSAMAWMTSRFPARCFPRANSGVMVVVLGSMY